MISKAMPLLAAAAVITLGGCSEHALPNASLAAANSVSTHVASSKSYARSVLVVANGFDGSVRTYGHEQSYPYQWKPLGIAARGLAMPSGLAIDAAGDLYIVNTGNDTITVFPPGAKQPSLVYSQGLSLPTGVAVGADGTVYAANALGGVEEYAAKSTAPSKQIAIHGQIGGLALDSSNNLYVAENSGDKGWIEEYAPGQTAGKRLPFTMGFAGGITLDSAGDLIVADEVNAVVDVFPRHATQPSRQLHGFFQHPVAVALNAAQNTLYVADDRAGVVQELNFPDGALDGTLIGPIPEGLAVSKTPLSQRGVGGSSPATHRADVTEDAVLYTVPTGSSSVEIWPANGGTQPIYQLSGGVSRPQDLVVDANRNLYVANNPYKPSHGPDYAYVSVYQYGQPKPFRMYSKGLTPTGGTSFIYAVGAGADGTVYVGVTLYPSGGGAPSESLVQYRPGSTTPSSTTPLPGAVTNFAFDAGNNLYVSFWNCCTTEGIDKYAPGSSQGQSLGVKMNGVGGIVFDKKGNLLLAGQSDGLIPSVINIFPPGATTPSRNIASIGDSSQMVFNVARDLLYVGASNGYTYVLSYPSGRVLRTISSGGYLAVSPAAVP